MGETSKGPARAFLARASLEGALAFVLCGALELVLAWHVPALYRDAGPFGAQHVRMTWIVLVGACAAGAISGALLGSLSRAFVRRGDPRTRPAQARAAGILGLGLVAGVCLWSERARPAAQAQLLVVALLCATAAWSAWVPSRAGVWSFLLNAPVAAALLALPQWVAQELLDRPSRLQARVAPLLLALAICALAFVAHARRREQEESFRDATATHAAWLLRRGWGLALAAWIALAAWTLQRNGPAASIARDAAAAGRPGDASNVVLVVLDTVRADHTSLVEGGADTTPRLAQLAEAGTRFEACVAAGDMTLSSHASLFTGLPARTHGAHFDEQGVGRALAPDFETLAEVLAREGWSTVGVAANHVFFGRGFGLEQGFAAFDARAPREYEFLHEVGGLPWYTLSKGLHRLLAARFVGGAENRHYADAADVVARSIAAFDAARAAGRPVFLFMNFMDAHWPYDPSCPDPAAVDGFDARFVTPDWRYSMVDEVVRQGSRDVSVEERRYMVGRYDDGIRTIDRELARFVDHLRERGELERTLFIVTSDHGEAFGEGGRVGHALGVERDQVDVPLVFVGPGVAPKVRDARVASGDDVAPTILSLLNVPALAASAGTRGRALLTPRASGAEPAKGAPESEGGGDVVAESYPNPSLGGPRFARTQWLLRRDRLGLVRATNAIDVCFDLASGDAGRPRPASEDVRAADLASALDRWLANTPEAKAPVALDDAHTLERLRALGYAGDVPR